MSQKKIKVIHIITKLELGGAQQTTLYTLSHMDKRYFIPVLICGPGGVLLQEARDIPGIRLYICPELIRPISPVHDSRAVHMLRKILLGERLSHGGPVIVHTHSSKAGILGRFAALLSGIPLRIHTVHGFGFNPYQPLLLKWALIFSEIVLGAVTTKMIYVSQDNLRQGIRLGISRKANSCIIRSGIEWSRFAGARVDRCSIRQELGVHDDTKLIGMVACFKPQKAPLDFIRMGYLVNKEFSDIHFVMTGDGVLRGKIEGMIADLGLEKRFHLMGWRRDIPSLVGSFDILALTSLWEGLPKVVVEAQLMGIPVVATITSGVEEVIRDGISGFLTPPKRPDIMARKIIELLKDPKGIKEMGSKGKSISKEFDLDDMVARHHQLYKDLLRKHP